jgi:hypothetical protein
VTAADGVEMVVDGKTIRSYPQRHGLSYELADAVVRDVHKLPFHRTYRMDGAHCYVVRHGYFADQDDKAVSRLEEEIAVLLGKVSGFFNDLVEYNTKMYEYQIMLSGVPVGDSAREKIRRIVSQIDGIGSAHKGDDNISAYPSGDASEANSDVMKAIHNILKAYLPHQAVVAAVLAL